MHVATSMAHMLGVFIVLTMPTVVREPAGTGLILRNKSTSCCPVSIRVSVSSGMLSGSRLLVVVSLLVGTSVTCWVSSVADQNATTTDTDMLK